MANHTVYPYGTDGELPSSIGLINDLTTGGADKALAAEQGKVIGDVLKLSSENLWKTCFTGKFLNESGGMTTNADYDSCQIWMIPGATYYIKNEKIINSNGNRVRVFKAQNDTYTQIYTVTSNGTPVIYTCPNDGDSYVLQVVHNKKNYDSDFGPAAIYRYYPNLDKFDQCISDLNEQVYLQNLFSVTMTGSYLGEDGSIITTSGYNSCQYEMNNGDTYRIYVQEVTTPVNTRVFRLENGTYTQIYVRVQNSGFFDYTCPYNGKYILQVIQFVNYNKANTPSYPAIYNLSKAAVSSSNLLNKETRRLREIKILSIGNSYSRDALSYVPFILEYTLGIKVTIGILYKGSCTLQTHYSYISNGTDYTSFDLYSPNIGNWTTTSSKNIDYALSVSDWDIILLQQQSDASRNYSTYQPYLNNIISALLAKLQYSVKIGWILTPAYPTGYTALGTDTSDEMFNKICSCVQRVMDETGVQFFIPCGTAIQNARTTTLNSIGDFGGLSYEGLHLQEGLPCLIEAYTSALKIMEISGYGKQGIYGNSIRPTQEWITQKAIPEQNGTSVGVTDSNCYLAQQIAAIAIKKPLQITQISL